MSYSIIPLLIRLALFAGGIMFLIMQQPIPAIITLLATLLIYKGEER
jgi:hypothetical protein